LNEKLKAERLLNANIMATLEGKEQNLEAVKDNCHQSIAVWREQQISRCLEKERLLPMQKSLRS